MLLQPAGGTEVSKLSNSFVTCEFIETVVKTRNKSNVSFFHISSFYNFKKQT